MTELLRQCNLLVQLPDGRGKRQWEPLQLDREHHQEQQTEPKHRHGNTEQGEPLYHLVETAAAIHPPKHAEYKADHTREHPCRQHQQERQTEFLPNDFEHRRTIDKRRAEVPMQNISRPDEEAFERRLVKAPVSGNKRVLLCRGRLVDEVCVNWING